MSVELRPIDRDNWLAVLRLKVKPHQTEFVASNAVSLAQAKVMPECVPLAVYAEEQPVGFVMYALDEEDHEYWIYRVMIDDSRQGGGLGLLAMQALIGRIRGEEQYGGKLYLSFEPENTAAKCLYERVGFHPDGRVLDGEVVYLLEQPACT